MCPSVGCLMLCLSVCHKVKYGREGYTSMLLRSSDLMFSFRLNNVWGPMLRMFFGSYFDSGNNCDDREANNEIENNVLDK